MVYAVQNDLKVLIKGAGMNSRDIAKSLGICPSTVLNKLNGFCILTETERRKILSAVENNKEGMKNGFEGTDTRHA